MCLVWSFEINFFLCCFGISYAVKQKKTDGKEFDGCFEA